MWHPYGDLTRNWSALDPTVPRILATILNGTIVAGMVVLLHRCRTARLIPCHALTHFAHEGCFLAPVYDRFTDGFCDCGHAHRASPARLAPAASSVTLICWRRPCARNSPWALPSGSKPGATFPLPLIDVPVSWSTKHQDNAAAHAPMREFLLRTLSSLSDALVSAQWREDWIPPAILDHDRFRQAPNASGPLRRASRLRRLTATIERTKSRKINSL